MALPTYTDYLKGEQSKRTLTPYELAQLNPPAPVASVPVQNNDGTTYVAPAVPQNTTPIATGATTNYDLSKPITSQQYNDLNNRTSGQVYSNSQAQGGNTAYASDPADLRLRDALAKKAEADQLVGYGETDNERIKSDTLKEFDAEIDAVNQLFASKLRTAQREGSNRLGQVSAIQSRSGLLGSTFGAGQDTKVGEEQQQIYGDIQNEQLSRINDIKFKAKVSSSERIAEKRKAKEEGLNSYITYLINEANRKKTVPSEVAAKILASGKDIKEIPADIEQIAKDQGVSVDSIKSAYNTLKKTQDEATADKLLATRKTESEIAKAGMFDLGEGQARYDATGKRVAFNPKTYAPKESVVGALGTYTPGGLYVAGTDATVDAYVKGLRNGTYKPPDIPAKYKNAVAVGFAQVGKSQNPELYDNISLVNDVLGNSESISGISQTGILPFGSGAKTKNQYQQLKGLLALDSREKLKGSGAVSDFESRTLERSASSLGRNLGEDDFKAELNKIKGVFQNAAGLPANVIVTNPANGEQHPTQLSREDINSAIGQGFNVDYK